MKRAVLTLALFVAGHAVAAPLSDWTTIGRSGGALLSTREAAAPKGARPRIWVRHEYPHGSPEPSSAVELQEVECGPVIQVHNLQTIHYAKSNMREAAGIETDPGAWVYPVPGTIAYLIAEKACGDDFLRTIGVDPAAVAAAR